MQTVVFCDIVCRSFIQQGNARFCRITAKKQGYWHADVSKSCHAQAKRRKTGKISSSYASQMLVAAIFREKNALVCNHGF